MRRKLASVLAFALLFSSLPALAADGEGRISGVVKDIRPEGKLVIEEQGPWHGPGTGIVNRTVDIAPGTKIQVVRSTGTWNNDANPGYEVEAADFRALKPGDFVTVTTGGKSAAASVEVMRSDETGLASPRTDALGTK